MKKERRIFISTISAFFLLTVIFFCIFGPKRSFEYSYYYYDTYSKITVYKYSDYQKLAGIDSKLAYYDSIFNKDYESSDIYRINNAKGEPVTVNDDTYHLLEAAYEFCNETGGAADITIAPLMDVWGFETDDSKRETLPSDSEISDALKLIDFRNVKLLGNNTVKLEGEGTKIDIGFIAKGYISDRIKDYMLSIGIESAMISLGGNIQAVGTKSFGQPFTVGVKKPYNQSEIISEIKVSDESVSTSGTYERYLIIDKLKYHHILDVNTGYPVTNGLDGVTVKAKSAADADALSTICLILGEEKSRPILERHNAEAIFY